MSFGHHCSHGPVGISEVLGLASGGSSRGLPEEILGPLGKLWASSGLRVPAPGSVYYLCTVGKGMASLPAIAYSR